MAKKPKIVVDTPYLNSWAHQEKLNQQAIEDEKKLPFRQMIEARKKRLAKEIESAKNCNIIFKNENIAWYMRLFYCDRETARKELGYSPPLATVSFEEYRNCPFRGGG